MRPVDESGADLLFFTHSGTSTCKCCSGVLFERKPTSFDAQPGGVYSNMSSHTAMCMQNDRPAARTGGRQRIVEIVKVTASPPSMSASSPAVLSVILPRRV